MIGLAGVMGGASTEVTDSTTRILVESARFDEVSVARTARRHKLISESSKRFERGVDPQIQAAAAQRAVELLVELAGAQVEPGVTDVSLGYEPVVIDLPADYTAGRIGVDYSPEQIESCLREIGCSVERTESGYAVTVPSWRTDLRAKEDLTEEIARIDGYENIPSTLPVAPAGRGYTPEQAGKRRALNALAASGLTEVFAYPFVSADANNLWSAPWVSTPENPVTEVPSARLENPISSAEGWMRRSLLPGLVEVLKRNLSRGFKNLAIFEAGHVFIPGEQLGSESIPPLGARPSDEVLADLNAGIPQQPTCLREIGCSVERTESGYAVTVPSWRTDLRAKEDLTEEIARIDGYENIPSTLPVAPAGRGYTPEQAGKRRALNALAASGLTEVFAYPFVSADANNLWSAPWVSTPENPVTEVPSIRLENPISSAEGWMRRSLLPGLVEVLKRNLSRGFKNLAIFEAGHVFIPGEQLGSESIPPLGARPSDEVLADLNAGIPQQPTFIAGLFAGTEHEAMPGAAPRAYDWRDALDAVRLVAAAVSAEIQVRNGVHTAFHPGRVAEVLNAAGERVGFAGELHPKLLQELNLPERTCGFELDFSALFAGRVEARQATPVLTFPAATQDVALLVDRDLPASEVERVLREGAGELLEDIRVFDDYRGTGIDESKKSLAFALRFRAPDRTLTADEASAAREAAVAATVEQLGAEPRV
ncbi:phenylalanyl-tRNA synthetase subunit beta [Mycobacterium tuberculosis]|nr:phenylalanyl-tRNA synthetase subunit beta [Mycobacterium tuberculosis]